MAVPTASSIFSLDSLPTGTLLFDIVMLLAGAVYVFFAQQSWSKQAPPRSHADLDRAASALGMFITVGVAGASVLLTGSGVVLGLGNDKSPLPSPVSTELVLAVGALIISLLCALITASYVLNHLHEETSLAENRLVVGSAVVQMVAMFLGAVAFMVSLLLF